MSDFHFSNLKAQFQATQPLSQYIELREVVYNEFMQLTFSLPDLSSLIPEIKSEVKIGDKLFKIQKSGSVSIAISQPLKIKPADIFSVLLKNIGDSISADDILAKKKTLLSEKTVIASETGVISKIDHDMGVVYIETALDESQTYLSFFNGTIVGFDKKTDLLTIELLGGTSYSLKSASAFGGGHLSILTEKDFFTIQEAEVDDHIVCVENLSNQIDAKFDALGAIGAVYLKGEGSKLEGYAQLINEAEFKKLIESKGKYIAFSGHEKKVVVY